MAILGFVLSNNSFSNHPILGYFLIAGFGLFIAINLPSLMAFYTVMIPLTERFKDDEIPEYLKKDGQFIINLDYRKMQRRGRIFHIVADLVFVVAVLIVCHWF